jgi:hypothetical protein
MKFWVVGPGVVCTTAEEVLKTSEAKRQLAAAGRLAASVKSGRYDRGN